MRHYDYQHANADEIVGYIKQGRRRPLVVQPVATGKTRTAAAIAEHPDLRKFLKVRRKALRVVLIAHTHRLLEQGAEVLEACEPKVEVRKVSSFLRDDDELAEAIEWCDIIMLDEAHHESMTTLQYKLNVLLDKVMIGFTATPDRPDRHIIKFDAVVDNMSREEAVDRGLVAKTDLTTVLDYAGVDKTALVLQTYEHFQAQFGKTIVFVRTRKEAIAIEAGMRAIGVKAVAVVNQTNAELTVLFKSFDEGRVTMMISCKKISEGLNVKGCATVFIAKRSLSLTQLNQEIGRGSRPDSTLHVWQLFNPFEGGHGVTAIVKKLESHRIVHFNGTDWIQTEVEL